MGVNYPYHDGSQKYDQDDFGTASTDMVEYHKDLDDKGILYLSISSPSFALPLRHLQIVNSRSDQAGE